MRKKLLISLVIGSLLSALTLYLAFRNVPFSQLAAYLGTINYWWLLPTVALVIATFILRAFRWQLILRHIAPLSYGQVFYPLMIGFMMNCILPGRVGELARPIILRQKNGIALTTGLATVAAERIFDIFMLIVLFAMVFGTITSRPDLDGVYFGFHLNSAILRTIAVGMVRLSIVLMIGIVLLAIGSTRRLIKLAAARFGGWLAARAPFARTRIEHVFGFIVSMIDNFSIGLSMVKSPVRLLACVGLTILIWTLTAFSYLVFAKGCPGIRLSLLELNTVMVVICFAIALPSVPGFWGVWEAGGVFALAIFAVSEKDALGFTLVNHAAQVFPVIVIGLVSALITSVNFLNLAGKKKQPTGGAQPNIEGA